MKTDPCGVLIVDKPAGLTSHDVVGKVRRALGTRRVGHAGTLDPMATGVLVVLVGEATKLAPFVSSQEKSYAANITFGRETSTLDREGETTRLHEVPRWLLDELRRLEGGGTLEAGSRVGEALEAEKRRTEQVPPNVSAIQIDGERSYDRARKGESFALEPRPVQLLAVRVTGATADPPELRIEVDVSKGFYVRSLARDLGTALGSGAHLSGLRRLRSGPFDLREAAQLDGNLAGRLLDLSVSAARALQTASLTEEGNARAKAGKALRPGDFREAPGAGPTAWMSSSGALVAVGEAQETDVFRVVRGFNAPPG